MVFGIGRFRSGSGYPFVTPHVRISTQDRSLLGEVVVHEIGAPSGHTMLLINRRRMNARELADHFEVYIAVE
jgi:hypothetical protein